ncbi:MAG: PorT family protein [Prevotellaceae bacterium]|jgi:hypothetical protein|nr:PorT family protein [Prevotellaceae bacterium]
MKKIIFITFVLFVSLEASAQFKLGVKGGWDFENFDIKGSIGSQLETKKSTAWNLGAVAQLHLSGNLYLQPEVLYSSQKITVDYSKVLQAGDDSDANLDQKVSYFQVPINILYKFNLLAVNPYVSGGAYFGYAVNRDDFSKETIKKTDWGVSIGAGIEFLGFQVSAKYNWGLINISDVSDISWKNNKFNVSVAFFIL